jgi:DNA repair exonuclease SbcCD ATPase subunit
VQLSFEHGGREYKAYRECPGSKVELYCDGKAIGQSITTVKEAMFERFGLDSKLFANVFYAEQDDLRRILERDPEERKVFVETLLGFDYLKDVKMSAKHAYDELTDFADEITGGSIKTVIQMIDELREQVEDKVKHVDQLEGELNRDKAESQKLNGSATTMSASQKKTEALQDRISRFENEKETNKEISSSIKSGKCPTCKQPIPKDIQLKLIHELNETITDLESRIGKIEREHAGAEGEWSRASRNYETYLMTNERVSNLQGSKKQYEDELKVLRTSLLKYEKQYKAFVNKKKIIEAIGIERDFLDRFQVEIESFRFGLRKNATTDLENGVNYFMSQFSDNDFDARLGINDDFAFEVMLHGKASPIFNLSGAAKDILALAMRYGLYRIAAKDVDFILFDEPTKHMDPFNTLKLKQAFNEMKNQQIIVITVHDEFFDADGKKFMIQKDDSFLSTIHEMN